VPRFRRAEFALGACRLDVIRLPRRTLAPLSRRSFFSLFSARWLSLTPPSGGLDEHAAARSLRRLINLIFACWLTHVMIRQGLPHPTSERPAHPELGSRVARGFPPYRTSAAACSSNSPVKCPCQKIEVYDSPNNPSLRHQHLPRGCRPDASNEFLCLNSFHTSRLRHRLALTRAGAR
jgi:hypothetical protein